MCDKINLEFETLISRTPFIFPSFILTFAHRKYFPPLQAPVHSSCNIMNHVQPVASLTAALECALTTLGRLRNVAVSIVREISAKTARARLKSYFRCC